MRVSDSANYQRFTYSRISSGEQFSAMIQSSISSPILVWTRSARTSRPVSSTIQPRLAPRANGQVLGVIGQKRLRMIESEPPNLVFRITSKVTFLEIGS